MKQRHLFLASPHMSEEGYEQEFVKQAFDSNWIAPLGENTAGVVQKLVYDLRRSGISVETDHMARSLKAQMKYADKLGCRFTAVIGDNEIENNAVKIKNMETGEQTEMPFSRIAAFVKGAQN